MCVKWRLHFEFVTSTKSSGERLDETKEGTCWTGPENIDIETMVWDLPIQIYPPVPSIANDPHAQTRITIVIWYFFSYIYKIMCIIITFFYFYELSIKFFFTPYFLFIICILINYFYSVIKSWKGTFSSVFFSYSTSLSTWIPFYKCQLTRIQ